MSTKKRLFHTAGETASHPAIWLASGNHALAMYLSGPASMDTAPTAIAAGIVFTAVTKAAYQGYTTKLPFFVLGGLTLATGCAAIAEPIQQLYSQSDDLLQAFSGQLRTDFLGASALIGWGTGHMFTGMRNAGDWAKNGLSTLFKTVTNAVNAKTSPNTNMICYSAADISAVCSNPVSIHAGPLIPAVAGLARSFYKVPEKLDDITGKFDRAMWHITPARLLAGGYLANSAIALTSEAPDVAFASISAIWAIGTYHMSPDQHNHLLTAVGLKRPPVQDAPSSPDTLDKL